jgi:hypothetical protein
VEIRSDGRQQVKLRLLSHSRSVYTTDLVVRFLPMIFKTQETKNHPTRSVVKDPFSYLFDWLKGNSHEKFNGAVS